MPDHPILPLHNAGVCHKSIWLFPAPQLFRKTHGAFLHPKVLQELLFRRTVAVAAYVLQLQGRLNTVSLTRI